MRTIRQCLLLASALVGAVACAATGVACTTDVASDALTDPSPEESTNDSGLLGDSALASLRGAMNADPEHAEELFREYERAVFDGANPDWGPGVPDPAYHYVPPVNGSPTKAEILARAQATLDGWHPLQSADTATDPSYPKLAGWQYQIAGDYRFAPLGDSEAVNNCPAKNDSCNLYCMGKRSAAVSQDNFDCALDMGKAALAVATAGGSTWAQVAYAFGLPRS